MIRSHIPGLDDNHVALKPRYVKILTDSQAALKSLDSIDFKSTIDALH